MSKNNTRLSDKYCEGYCKETGGRGKFKDCTGCDIAELEQQINKWQEVYKVQTAAIAELEQRIAELELQHPARSIDND